MNNIKLNTNTNFLKIIALLTMLIDHIGIIFFKDTIIFRIIGRISFPLFAYCAFIGFHKTKDLKKYLIRMLVFAVISQPIYVLVLNADLLQLNIFFTLLFELILLFFIDNKKYIFSLLIIALIILLNVNYSLQIICLVPLFYYLNKDKLLFSLSFFLMNTILLMDNQIINFFSLLSLPFLLINTKINVKINKWFYYTFYPIHLLILFGIKNIL